MLQFFFGGTPAPPVPSDWPPPGGGGSTITAPASAVFGQADPHRVDRLVPAPAPAASE